MKLGHLLNRAYLWTHADNNHPQDVASTWCDARRLPLITSEIVTAVKIVALQEMPSLKISDFWKTTLERQVEYHLIGGDIHGDAFESRVSMLDSWSHVGQEHTTTTTAASVCNLLSHSNGYTGSDVTRHSIEQVAGNVLRHLPRCFLQRAHVDQPVFWKGVDGGANFAPPHPYVFNRKQTWRTGKPITGNHTKFCKIVSEMYLFQTISDLFNDTVALLVLVQNPPQLVTPLQPDIRDWTRISLLERHQPYTRIYILHSASHVPDFTCMIIRGVNVGRNIFRSMSSRFQAASLAPAVETAENGVEIRVAVAPSRGLFVQSHEESPRRLLLLGPRSPGTLCTHGFACLLRTAGRPGGVDRPRPPRLPATRGVVRVCAREGHVDGDALLSSCPKKYVNSEMPGAAMAEWLVRPPPAEANLVQSPARSQDFRMWESCRTMPLVDGFIRGYPFSPFPFIPALLHANLSHPHRLRPRC
ncbi:hypothetical protein PR048_014824 [Dryococelus australis]|uniref:Uncharacterized protein n=1 Tax=Dryococelus australis TaxID=614101 RepID=A0ABQ9HFH2_9NEOP|nr:hypothetical protein PR048_014824 [Dryococelus australis]